MSILSRRWLLNTFFVIVVLVPLVTVAQVTIKEKVEIHAGRRSPESLAAMPPFLRGNTVILPFGGEVFVQSTVYAPLQAHQYLRMNGQIVLSDLQLTPFMNLGTYNGGARLTFEYLVIDSDATPIATSFIPITAIQPLWEVNDCSSGQVFELGRTVDPGDGSEMFWSYGVLVGVERSVPVRPASKLVVWDAEAIYTGDATLSAALQDVCGNQVESPGITVEAKIVGGREWGELFDPLTGEGGTTLDSVREEGGWYRINFHAWGTEPHQIEQVTIHLATSDGKYTSDGTITVYPYSYPLSVIPGRRQIPPGDTTKLDIQMLNPDWTPSTGELLSTTYTIVQGGAWAYLYSPDSSVVGPSITGLFPSVRLFVPSSPELPDSLDVVLIAQAEEPSTGGGDSKIVRDSNATLPGGLPPKVLSANPGQASLPTVAEAASGIFANRSTRLRDSMIAVYRMRFGEQKLSKTSTLRPALLTVNSNRYLSGSPPPMLQYTLSHYGLVRVTVKKQTTCAQTIITPSSLAPGGTASLSFKTTDGADFPTDQEFDVFIQEGGDTVGVLLSSTGNGRILNKAKTPISYIAPSAVNGSMTVHIWAVPNSSASGGVNSMGESTNGLPLFEKGLGRLATQSSTKKSVDAQIARLLRRLSESSCPMPTPLVINGIERICQTEEPWGSRDYDKSVNKKETKRLGYTYYNKVRDNGCALTCLTMIAKAGGAKTNPEVLNSQAGFYNSDGDVMWGFIDGWNGNTKYKCSPPYIGNGLKRKSVDGVTKVDKEHSNAIDLGKMDSFLSKGDLIVAQVYNPTTGRAHFVLVVSKSNNEYKILDPACYHAERTTLGGEYDSKVYEFMVFKKQS